MGCPWSKCIQRPGPSIEELRMEFSLRSSAQESTYDDDEVRFQYVPRETQTESPSRTADNYNFNIILTDTDGDEAPIERPSSSRSTRFVDYRPPSVIDPDHLQEDDAYDIFRRKRAQRTPSAFALIKRNLFYRSFPLCLARKKSMEKRMKKQKLDWMEEGEGEALSGGRIRVSTASSGSSGSKTQKSSKSLPLTCVIDLRK
ncbi:hypothetical protein JTB14_032161 [Gonioctena quinquepunctata]|nr:hypothetical protein JTB14_032161 [Gonioctena quinquepunctata]